MKFLIHSKILCYLLFISIFADSVRSIIEQVHLSLGYDDTSIVVTFHSRKPLRNCTISYRSEEERGTYSQVDCHMDTNYNLFDSVYTYRSMLIDLIPERTYYYQINELEYDSQVFTYRPWNNTKETSWALFGDLGLENAVSFPLLFEHVQNNRYSCIFHIGDIGYNLNERKGELGNDFMKMIQPIVSSVPYQVCAGNHERRDNFTHYNFRFSMIHDRLSGGEEKIINNYYHSFDLGPAHVIMFDTEFYNYPEYRGWHHIREQYEWLEKDLIKSNRKRNSTPWIIVMGHRPLYCFRIGDKSCTNNQLERYKIRRGIQMFNRPDAQLQYGLEDLFFRYGVDIQFYGHEHHYVRTFPLYNNISESYMSIDIYEDPLAPVHIITGTAGNREKHPALNRKAIEQQWLAVQSFEYGFTTIEFGSNNELYAQIQQWSAERNQVIDSFRIVKSNPAPAWQR